MTKLVYPDDGIKIYVQNNLDSAIENLKSATYNSLYVPNNFRYATYINNLKNNLNSYKNEINSINDEIKSIELNYIICSNTIKNNNKLLETKLKKKRDRLIK